jgi:diguanylate cyclase (GGDEF)-like protein
MNTDLTLRERLAALVAPSLVEKRDLALRLANTDALTGLGNRAALELATPEALRQASAFIVFDANNFGKVNKLFNHLTGDRLLKQIAGVLAGVAKAYNVRAFRMGGDEFVIICPRRFATAIRDSVERRVKPQYFPPMGNATSGFAVSITGEVGVTVTDADNKLQERKARQKSLQAQTIKPEVIFG